MSPSVGAPVYLPAVAQVVSSPSSSRTRSSSPSWGETPTPRGRVCGGGLGGSRHFHGAISQRGPMPEPHPGSLLMPHGGLGAVVEGQARGEKRGPRGRLLSSASHHAPESALQRNQTTHTLVLRVAQTTSHSLTHTKQH